MSWTSFCSRRAQLSGQREIQQAAAQDTGQVFAPHTNCVGTSYFRNGNVSREAMFLLLSGSGADGSGARHGVHQTAHPHGDGEPATPNAEVSGHKCMNV